MRRIGDIVYSPRRERGHRSRMSPEKKAFARDLRGNPTVTYRLLWEQLRRKRLGVRFLRRAPLFGWIPDFWCPSRRIAVEIDYQSDSRRWMEHRSRDRALAERGILVLRFSAERVYADVEQVVREIELVCQGGDA